MIYIFKRVNYTVKFHIIQGYKITQIERASYNSTQGKKL